MAFVLDQDGTFEHRVNPEGVQHQRVQTPYWEGVLKGLVERHVAETQSKFAESLLRDWDRVVEQFWQVVPREMIGRLEHPTLPLVAAE